MMEHIFQKGTNDQKPTFLMLHGLGGTERDLIPLAKKLQPEASVLSVRGQVLENEKCMFYKSNEEDLTFRTEELYQFINEAAEKYRFHRNNIVALGYSNGAAMALSLLFHHADVLKAAILYHPQVPRRDMELPDLSDVSIFIGASKNNPFISRNETELLEKMLKDANAHVTLHWENSKQYLSGEIFAASRSWYENIFS